MVGEGAGRGEGALRFWVLGSNRILDEEWVRQDETGYGERVRVMFAFLKKILRLAKNTKDLLC